ncbi:MAG: hypothetical protein ACP5NV_05370 [Candidatus Woesearchaeota archaeon]
MNTTTGTILKTTPIIPQFINECIFESENNKTHSFTILDAFESAEKQYGKLSHSSQFYVNEMINTLIESEVLLRKGNSLYYKYIPLQQYKKIDV